MRPVTTATATTTTAAAVKMENISSQRKDSETKRTAGLKLPTRLTAKNTSK